jgi:hypothetical protein
LLWAGPPLPVFHPHRSDVRAVRDELMRGTKVRRSLPSALARGIRRRPSGASPDDV